MPISNARVQILGESAAARKLLWYGRRLRTMDSQEVFWRASQALHRRRTAHVNTSKLLRYHDDSDWRRAFDRFRSGNGAPALLTRTGAECLACDCPNDTNEILNAARRSMESQFQFFGYPAATLRNPIDWNYDPIAGVTWPIGHSRTINHRVSHGDVKWIWELNRLQHLPWLAQAYLLTGDEKFSRCALEHLEGWMEQNPPGQGIAWRGAFEVGIRAISIVTALQGLRESQEFTLEIFKQVVNTLAHSASMCWEQRSRYSSANNHLIGEMAGLAVIAIAMPDINIHTGWREKAVDVLCAEADRQLLADGMGAEQAVGYQLFTAELLNLVAVLLMEQDGSAPAAITRSLQRSTTFLAATVGTGDPPLRYGDDDEGFALRLGASPIRTVRDHLAILGASPWGQAGRSAASDTVDAKWFTMLTEHPGKGVPRDNASGADDEPPQVFADAGGLVLLRARDRRITMDVGSLGHLSIAAHGHADALAVTLASNGFDVSGDPGTGSYYGHPEWRAVMRGTRAHGTILVDQQDQSVAGGPFMWLRHARTTVRSVDLSGGVVEAEHDGYERLHGRVSHRRWLVAPPHEPAFLVVDLLTGGGTHEVRSTWPLHPSLSIRGHAKTHALMLGEQPMWTIQHASTALVHRYEVRGDEVNHEGWWSRRLESREPAWWVGVAGKAALPVVIATLFSPDSRCITSGLSVVLEAAGVDIQWTEERKHRKVYIDTQQSLVQLDGVQLIRGGNQ